MNFSQRLSIYLRSEVTHMYSTSFVAPASTVAAEIAAVVVVIIANCQGKCPRVCCRQVL